MAKGDIFADYLRKDPVTRSINRNIKKSDKARYVQACNPVTKRFVKISRVTGSIVSHKKTPGPYKGIPIKGKRYDKQRGGV